MQYRAVDREAREVRPHGAVRVDRRQRRHAHQQIADVSHARIRQQPLHVRLRERREVADRHGERRERRHYRSPVRRYGHERVREKPQRQRQRRRLRRRRQPSRYRNWRAFVNVRRPHVERNRRQLESEPGENHPEADYDSGRQPAVRRRQNPRHLVEPRSPHKPVYLAYPVQQQRRRHRAQQNVLRPRLVRLRIVAVERRQYVQPQAKQLKRYVRRKQLARRRNQHHAHDGEYQYRVVLARVS